MKEEKFEFNRAAALHYAEAHGVDIPEGMDDTKIVKVVEKWVKENLPKKEGDRFRCDCKKYILDPDTYCWYCGTDVSKDGTGGFDKVIGKKNKVKTSKKEEDDEGDDEELEKEEDDEGDDEELEKEEDDEDDDEDDEDDEELEKEEGDEDEGGTLKERTERILSLSRDSGANAWNIGFELHQINSKELYKQEKFKDFGSYVKKSFGMERASAYNYIRISQSFELKEIAGLTYEKLIDLAKIADKGERKRLLKAAKPKSEGGKGLTRKEVKQEVAKSRKKSKTKSKSPGRPKLSRYAKFVGDTFRGEWDSDDEDHMIVEDVSVLGRGVGVEVKKLKKGLKFEVVELEDENEEE